MKPLYRLTPHSRLSHNPLFALEIRRVRRSESAKTLVDYSLLLVTVICVVIILLWLLLRLTTRASARIDDFSLVLLALSFLSALPLDYRSMASALGAINSEIAAGRWDLLRMTALESREIVAAKYGAAQVRVWRLMVLVIALRLGVTLTVGLNLLLQTQQDARLFTSGETVSIVLAQLMLVVVAALYVVEPYWRMRSVTALGMAISARALSQASTVLAGVGALAAFWLAQGVLVVGMALGISFLVLPLALVESSVNRLLFCAPLLFIAALFAAVYGFYSTSQAWGVRRALRWTSQIN